MPQHLVLCFSHCRGSSPFILFLSFTSCGGASETATAIAMDDKTLNQRRQQPGTAASDEKSESWGQLAWAHLECVRNSSSPPLIQCITNFVSMDLVANVLLSAGASPAMIHSVEEIPEFTPKVHALYINVGTLTPAWLPAMKKAAAVANESRRPWVLDPVAAGASAFRLKACLELLTLRPTVVRGNGSEILVLFNGSANANFKGADSMHESTDAIEAAKSLARTYGCIVAVSGAVDIVTDGELACLELLTLRPTVVRGNGSEILVLFNGSANANFKGADSMHESTDAIEAAKSLARTYGCIVAVSGAVDIVTDGERVVGAKNGVPMLQKITATGCAVTALIAAFVAVSPSQPFEATAAALSVFGVAGELGMCSAGGPGSLRVHLIDALHGLDRTAVLQRVNIANVS